MTYEHVAGSRRYFAWAPNDYAVVYTVSARVGRHTLTPSQIQQRYHLAARGLFEDPPQRLIDFLNHYEETYGVGDHAQVRLVYSLDGHPQRTWTRN